MNRSLILLAVTFLLLCSRVGAQTSARDIAQKCFRSVVLLVMEDAKGQPLSMGSGFFVKTNVIATNRHVIEGGAGGYAKLVGQIHKFKLKGILALEDRKSVV